MLADTKIILEKARRKNYAVAHFNINNLEIVQGVVAAAVKLKAPIILATSEGALNYAGMNYLYSIAKTASELHQIPIALHLDHGKNLKAIRQAINLGYSSVMIDASHEKFERNVRLTKKVVRWAHRKGVSVEAELGTIGGTEDLVSARKIIYTNPEKAREFIDRTGCDFLAVAIGTSHGAYKFKGTAKLRIDLLKEIKNRTKIPLVLHGASGVPKNVVKMAERYGANLKGVQGVPDQQISLAVKNGINKINTDTDLRIAFDAAVRNFLKGNPKDFDPRHILAPARDLIQKVAEQRIILFGSVKKG
ncbi:MAG: class II fructose-1,6-bisphosphate aldolase [Nanoarchaeota archaeon]|nr:class II fructose-1,6-bisphosphate aldolase [Nanoarchaeota archaeon]MBU1644259.1 class II fructose-1,6-bisphosphate aldolase [Nanoarchaeota archaeon]MBU1976999.1 class II fructose-1,6-bisphosphate aldolase [Nanoarchaeota archaeon]